MFIAVVVFLVLSALLGVIGFAMLWHCTRPLPVGETRSVSAQRGKEVARKFMDISFVLMLLGNLLLAILNVFQW